MSKKSVDEIWKELNAKSAPRSRASGITGFGIPGVSTTTRVLPKGPTGFQTGATGRLAEDVNLYHDTQKHAAAYNPADAAKSAGVNPDELAAYLSGIQRPVNCLTDQDRSARRSAIKTLHAKLLMGDAAHPKASPSLLQALLCGPLLQPLTVMCSDSVEACRSTTLQLLSSAIPQMADPGPMLPLLLPAMVGRIGEVPVLEEAEELRLAIVQLLAGLINQLPDSLLQQYLQELVQLLVRCLDDSYHEVKKAASGAVVALAHKLGPAAMEGYAEKLLQAVLLQLGHQHSKVRLALVAALAALGPGLPAAQVEALLVPGLKPLLTDRHAGVREATFRALAHWMGAGAEAPGPAAGHPAGSRPVTAAEPCADWGQRQAHLLLPLLLLGVSDEQSDLAARVLELVEVVGQVWQKGQQDQQPAAADMEVDEPAGVQQQEQESSCPASVDGSLGSNVASSRAEAGMPSVSAAAVIAAQLPPPYQGLPSPGCRAMVAALLPTMVPSCLKELGEWTSRLRVTAARCLHTQLVMAGRAASSQLPRVLPALTSAVGDEEMEVITRVASSARCLGAFTCPVEWLPLLLDGLGEGSKSSPGRRANALVIASCLIRAAAESCQAAEQQLMGPLVGVLAGEEVRGSDHPGVQAQLLCVVQNLLMWLGPAAAAHSQQLYLLLLQLHGRLAASSSGQQVDQTLAQLAAACSLTSPGELAAKHAGELLPLLTAEASSWTASAPNLLAFQALLRTTEGRAWAELLPSVLPVLAGCCSSEEADPGLRLHLLRQVDELLEDEAKTPATVGAPAGQLLEQVLLPPLVWRAGKVAAAIRFAAITAIATLLRRQLLPAAVLQPILERGKLLPLLMQCLDEDWYSDVRYSSVYVVDQLLQLLGPSLSPEVQRTIYPELLKRLDDSNDQVRIAACSALVAFVKGAGPSYCDTNSSYVAAGVVVHMDDGQPTVQEAACRVMEALAAVKPTVVLVELSKVRQHFRSQQLCDRVVAQAEAAQQQQQAVYLA